MKVLMTGCTGHAGAHALNHFVNNGHEVHALVRPHHIPNLEERDNANGFIFDLLNYTYISNFNSNYLVEYSSFYLQEIL